MAQWYWYLEPYPKSNFTCCCNTGNSQNVNQPTNSSGNMSVIHEVIPKLTSGDISALDILKNNGITFMMQETPNGFTCNFTYNGSNYTVVYIAPKNANETPEVPSRGAGTTPPPTTTIPTTSTTNSTTTTEKESVDTGLGSAAGKALSKAIDEVLENKIDNIIENGEMNKNQYGFPDGYSINTEFGLDIHGDLVFQAEKTKAVYEELARQVKRELNNIGFPDKDYMKQLGGEKVIDNLIKAAWVQTYNDFDSSAIHDASAFIKKVLTNLEDMVSKLHENPEMYNIYSQELSYADSSLTDGLVNYDNNTTVSFWRGSEVGKDGKVHLTDRWDDSAYQATMDDLLSRLKTKYPNLDEDSLTKIFRLAQANALKILDEGLKDCPNGTFGSGNVKDFIKNWEGDANPYWNDYFPMDQLVQMTLYQFDKQLFESLSSQGADIVKELPAITTQTKKVENAIDSIDKNLTAVLADYDDEIYIDYTKYSDGDLRFQDSDARKIYKQIINLLNEEVNKIDSTLLEKIGGEDAFEQLLQTAWIVTSQDFSSDKKVETEEFVSELLENLKNMMKKMEESPKMYSIFNQESSYLDSELTKSLPNYEENIVINWSRVTSQKDGTVEINGYSRNRNYQSTMEELLTRLTRKYAGVDSPIIKKAFQQAQLKVLQENVRKDISYQELVQKILKEFDNNFYKELLK